MRTWWPVGVVLVMLNGVGRFLLPPNVDSTIRLAPGLNGKERELIGKHSCIVSVSTLHCVTNETFASSPAALTSPFSTVTRDCDLQ